ncbi:hypothetical protein EJ02DRAFT_260298 [Clathrospora elynae]|uniref:Uncharacterized protein n=1 Tax=Clathrospora elynae TaxID=706981 RepID=A0A6A5T1F6_9PLEO|nr:hypothetical protein EJ02DRAFT_260298 [Clathrospora elynae]
MDLITVYKVSFEVPMGVPSTVGNVGCIIPMANHMFVLGSYSRQMLIWIVSVYVQR